jgi:hypothetical protein
MLMIYDKAERAADRGRETFLVTSDSGGSQYSESLDTTVLIPVKMASAATSRRSRQGGASGTTSNIEDLRSVANRNEAWPSIATEPEVKPAFAGTGRNRGAGASGVRS